MKRYEKIVEENPEYIDINKVKSDYDKSFIGDDFVVRTESLLCMIYYYIEIKDMEKAQTCIESLSFYAKGEPFRFFKNRFDKKTLSIYKKSYPIVLAIVAIINSVFNRSIMKNPKIFGLFMAIIPLWYAWNITVNNLSEFPAWCFSKYSIFGMEIFRMQLEDYFFYPLCSWMLYILIRKIDVFKKSYQSSLIFILALMLFYSHLDVIGLSISILVFPFVAVIIFDEKTKNFFSNKTFFFMNVIFVPVSGFWDLNSTTIKLKMFGLVEWYYPRESNLFNDHLWLWNSPASITPWLTIAGIFITYVSYCFLESRYNNAK